MNKHDLIGKIRQLMQPSLLSLYRIDGILRHNGKTVSDSQLKAYQERHRIRIFNIVPASKRLRASYE